LIGRVALHAEELVLSHPMTGELLKISAPWPKDLVVAIKYLRRYGAASLGPTEAEVRQNPKAD
jgi:hypothetical protein